MLIGTLSLIGLPIGEFPNIALPTVQVNSFYLGASSDVVEESVTTPIDQQINGATDMLYINSVSGDDGASAISVTFALERDPDLAAVEVQNRVSQANSQLPSEVINAGITVLKQSPDVLMYFALHSPNATYDPLFISNYGFVYVVDELEAGQGRRRRQGVRLRLRHARVAQARPHGEPRHHRKRRRAGHPRAERAGARGPGRPAAIGARPELPVFAAGEGPPGESSRVRRHHRRLQARRVVRPGAGHRHASNSVPAPTATYRPSTASRRRRSRSRWSPAPTRWRPPRWSRRS